MTLPTEKVKLALIDKNISSSAKELLKCSGIEYIETTDCPNISDSTSTHPDMQFLKIAPYVALVDSSVLEHYKKLLPGFELITVSGIRSPYPFDSVLNVTLIKNNCFLTEFQNSVIGHHLKNEKILINQGYSKCNICVLNENAILTSDRGIIKNAENFGFKAYFLPCDEIILDGYKNGFWGGCTGLIDINKLFINGNIENMSCYSVLLEILEKEKIEPLYSKDYPVTDNGSIIPII